MRLGLFTIFVMLFAVAVAPRACGQSLALHQSAPVAATTTTPAKATASAIIPGSPLAALTGAATAGADADSTTPAPFGTENLGLSLTSAIGSEAAGTLGDFIKAVDRSTRLTPVWDWLRSFGAGTARRAHAMDTLAGLAIAILPALAAEALIRLGLARPRAAVRRRAVLLHAKDQPVPEAAAGIAQAEAGETEFRPRHWISLRFWLRRFGLALLHLLLAFLPIFAFAGVAGGILGGGLITTREARLGIIGFSNAYLFCRISVEFLRFLLAPDEACLRLVHVPDRRALYIVEWFRALLISGTFGYFIVSLAEVLGLSHAGALVIARLIALVIHIELAIIIWQSRRVVGHWIAGKPDAPGFVAGFRRRLGQLWHFFALFYVMALWIALAGGVHNAFAVLLRVVLVFIAALVVGRLAWNGSARMLERLFPDTGKGDVRHALFYERARAYNPLLRGVIRVIIGIAVLVIILQGWGIDAAAWLLKDPISRSLISAFISIVITVAVALLLWEVANALINGRIDRLSAAGRVRQASRLRTLLPMLKASLGVTIFLIAGLICLSKIGVNAAPLLAGAGVLGIAIGFGSQKLVQDIITGLFLLLEDAMQVGDVVSLASMSGTVERLSIRTIRLRGGDGSINIIPFSAVTTVTNMTRDFGYAQISIQVGYDEDLARVYAVLTDIGRTMRAEPAWKAMIRDDLQIFGLDQFGASALVITGQIRTGPGQHWAVRREFNARVKRRFEDEGIEIPYTYLPPPPPVVSGPSPMASEKEG